MAPEHIDTVVGAQVELKGSLHNQGAIHIHGHVVGDIHCDDLVVIGETAVVQGPITARQVEIAGQVHGSVVAESNVELHPKSIVKGDITTKSLSIRPGAIFIGMSNMEAPASPVSHPSKGEESEVTPEPRRKPRLEID